MTIGNRTLDFSEEKITIYCACEQFIAYSIDYDSVGDDGRKFIQRAFNCYNDFYDEVIGAIIIVPVANHMPLIEKSRLEFCLIEGGLSDWYISSLCDQIRILGADYIDFGIPANLSSKEKIKLLSYLIPEE